MIAPGSVLGKYRIESHLGGGNMGDVYVARHTATGRQLAVKVLRNQLLRNDLAREKFATEVRVGAVIGESHHIVEVSDAGFDPTHGVPYLVMPLLRGEALDATIARGPLEPRLALRLMIHLARALDQAHDANVVHRDIKPSNLFVVPDHEGLPLLKVLDFGIAKVLSAQGDMTATELGTPAYRAPEQLAPMFKQLASQNGVHIAMNVSSATDVWALALVAYECLTGHGPGQVWSVQSVQEIGLRILQPSPTPSIVAGDRASLLPRGFDGWFAHCVERDATRRCQRASEAVAALEALFAQPAQPAQPAVPKPMPVGTLLGAAVATYGPSSPHVVEAVAPASPAAIGKQTALAGAVESFVPGAAPPVPAAMTTGGAGVTAQSVEPVTPRKGKWLAFAGVGVGFAALAGIAVMVSSRGDPPAVPPPPVASAPSIASAVPMDSAKLAAAKLAEEAERHRVGASVILPAGSFLLGNKDGEEDERDTQRTTLTSFELDVDEVTVERFAACVKANKCEAQYNASGKAVGEGEIAAYWSRQCNWGIEGREQHPMNCVDWKQAEAFCAWVGKRLPTEAEWEYAAGAGEKELLFPWGSDQPTSAHANACGPECTEPLNTLFAGVGRRKRLNPIFDHADGYEGTAPVGSYEKGNSPVGMRDMAGNVWEWTASPYCTYGTTKCLTERVARGGGWDTPKGEPSWLRGTFRNYFQEETRAPFLGFRCAKGGG